MTIDEFQKIDLRVGVIEKAERVEGSEKLLVLSVSLGEEVRQIIAGIGGTYTPDELLGQRIIVVANLLPRTLMGTESAGMFLAAEDPTGKPRIVTVREEVAPGTRIR